MPVFLYNDTISVENYLKSLDKFKLFDQIELITVPNLLELKIFSRSKVILQEVFTTSDRQNKQIFFDDKFEKRIESLSAALDIQRRLSELKEIKESHIFFDPNCVMIRSSSDFETYEVRIFNYDTGFKIFVKMTVTEKIDGIYCERVYCTNGSLIDYSISNLEEVLQKFESLDVVRIVK